MGWIDTKRGRRSLCMDWKKSSWRHSFYDGGKAVVCTKEEPSVSFDLKRGMKQRCVMAPWLFSVYMDEGMTEVKNGSGCKSNLGEKVGTGSASTFICRWCSVNRLWGKGTQETDAWAWHCVLHVRQNLNAIKNTQPMSGKDKNRLHRPSEH